MKAFVTGASGGLGRSFALALAEAGHDITALARNPAGLPVHPRISSIRGDLLDPSSFAQALDGAEAIVHLAGLTHSPDPKAYERVNVDGTAGLVAACREHCPAARFLYVGTRATGEACGAYGASKARAEAVLRASGQPFVIARPAEVYGVGKGEAVAALGRACARGGLVPMPGLGRHVLAPVHVDDVIAAMLAALTAPGILGRTYVLAGPERISFADLADKLAARAGRRIFKLPMPLPLLAAAAWGLSKIMARPPLVSDQVPRLTCPKDADIAPARADLGFAPRSLEAGLDAILGQ